VRNLDEIVRAQAHGADHVGLGPIFRTSTKVVDAPVLGVFGFRAIVARSPLPVVGIAGITLQTIGEVALAGATAAAVASDLFLADDVVERARALSRAFARHQQ
jgi:thiamine-phosphate pyrophosphorylase